MAGEHYTLDEVLEMIDDAAEPMTYGSDKEFEDLVVEKAMDVEVSTEYESMTTWMQHKRPKMNIMLMLLQDLLEVFLMWLMNGQQNLMRYLSWNSLKMWVQHSL